MATTETACSINIYINNVIYILYYINIELMPPAEQKHTHTRTHNICVNYKVYT